jgi:hypothetical protein
MARHPLHTSIGGIESVWGSLSTEVVAACRGHLKVLLKAPATEDWLAALHQQALANKELYCNPTNGFVLLAHRQPTGLYRPHHDHGRGWVIYAIQQGEIEMGTVGRLEAPDGSASVVFRSVWNLSAH